MNVYAKLQKSRVDLQSAGLKKTGKNTFSGYSYFELNDFLPKVNEIFNNNKLFSQVTFNNEFATLAIINTEKPDECIMFSSPMATATLKGNHDIQNLGAVQSYQRRYLYLTALEIAEHDVLDATTGEDKPQKQPQQNSQGQQQPPKNNQSQGPKLASEPQIKKLNTVITELAKLGGTADMIKDTLKGREEVGKFESLKELTVGQASAAIKIVEDWIKRKKEKQNGGN